MLKKLLIKVFKTDSGNVFKAVKTLLIGAGLARVIGLISIPVLTRIYSPDDYGVLALYISLVTILLPITNLRYANAIPLPKSDAMGYNLFVLCLIIITIFTMLLSFFLFFPGEYVLYKLGMESLIDWRILIILACIGASLYEVFSLWAIRKKQYKVISKTQFSQALIGNFTKVALGLLAFKPSGLLIGHFLTQSSGIMSFVRSSKKEFKLQLRNISLKRIKLVAHAYRTFVWFRLPSQLLMVLSTQAPILMMATMYGKEYTGQLSLAMMALALPVNLIGNAVSNAYFGEIASLGRNNLNKIKSITLSVQKKLFMIGVPIAALVMFFAEPLFVFAFGDKWELAGQFAVFLAPYILLQFTSSPLVQALNVVGTQLSFLTINIIRICGFVLLFSIVNYLRISEAYFVMLISFYLSLFYLFQTIFVVKVINAGGIQK